MSSLVKEHSEITRAINKCILNKAIDIPRVVIIGNQSSGKSSAIEFIVGVDFLPRGTGMVTKVPLEILLINTEEERLYAEFEHVKNKQYDDFNEVRQEIETQTGKLCGVEGKVVNRPIFLTIYSSEVPNLSLVDLPGLVNVNTDITYEGIKEDIENLVTHYVTPQNTIIVVVSEAINDTANCKGFGKAKEVDPDMKRTLWILTKIDIMNAGTDAYERLRGVDISLELGYYGIKWRDQQENIDGMSIEEAKENEKVYFENHDKYKKILPILGIEAIWKRLSDLLNDHIINLTGRISSQININLKSNVKEYALIGEGDDSESPEAIKLFLMDVISDYWALFKDSIMGSSEGMTFGNCDLNGSRIFEVFEKFRTKKLVKLDLSKYFSDAEILYEIKKCNGINPSMFVPEGAMKTLIRKCIEKLMRPWMECIEEVSLELNIASQNVMGTSFTHRKDLKKFIIGAMDVMIYDKQEKCEEETKDMFETEQSYISWDHDDFESIKGSILSNTDMKSTICDMMTVLSNNFKFRYYIDNGTMQDREIPLSTEGNTQVDSEDSDGEEVKSNYRRTKVKTSAITKDIYNNYTINREITKEESLQITMTRNVIFHYTNILIKQVKSFVPKIIGKVFVL